MACLHHPKFSYFCGKISFGKGMPFIKFGEFTLGNTLPGLVPVPLCLCEKEFCNLRNGVYFRAFPEGRVYGCCCFIWSSVLPGAPFPSERLAPARYPLMKGWRRAVAPFPPLKLYRYLKSPLDPWPSALHLLRSPGLV